MMETWRMSAGELSTAIRGRQVSCREVMETLLARIEELDRQTNSFAFVDPAAARQAADEADRLIARGAPTGPLHGLPISVKDLIDTGGMRTAHGSHVFAENVPASDAEAVARVRRAGAIVFGKTTTPEFGCKILTDSPLHGTTRNPWNLDRSPGGSSGGAAVAIAMGFGPLALTTDGAGSSRIPAASCGVVGLKPTLGAVPMERAADLFGGLSCIGVMARTAADVGLLHGVIAGPCERDPWTLGSGGKWRGIPSGDGRAFDGLRVRWLEKVGNRVLDPEVLRLATSALARMVDAGARLVDAPDEFDWATDACRILIRASQAARHARLLDDWRERLDPITVQCVEEGLGQGLPELRQAILDRTSLFRRVQGLFEDADVIVTPTFAATPPLATQRADEPFAVAGTAARPLRESWYSYTIPFNPSGHPAISVPCGVASDGMPVGLQIVGPWHSEGLLIALAQEMETMVGWREKWPQAALGKAGSGKEPA